MDELVVTRRQHRQATIGIEDSAAALKNVEREAICPLTQLHINIYVAKIGIRSCSIYCLNNSK